MSSPNLEDGELISEEPNETLQANDKLLLQKTVNTKLDEMHFNGSGSGVGAGVIVATLSISMEQSHELGYEALNNVETVDGNVTAKTTTLSMSRTQTRKIVTTAYSADCPLDIDTVVTFGDQPITKIANETSTAVDGKMKRNKRRILSKKNNAEIQPPKKRSPMKGCSSLKGNRFSVLASDSQIDDCIDDDEMLCVRGASPQHKQLLPYPSSEILTNLCLSDNNLGGKLKPFKKAKTRKGSSKRAGSYSRAKKPKNKLNIDGKKKTNQMKLSSLNEEDEGFAILPDEDTTLHLDENKLKPLQDNPTHEMNCCEKLNNIETLQEMREKMSFLTEEQIGSLLQLNVHRPEQALHLSLWQLNSIGINKATQFEAMLATVLNRQDVDMRKLLPQPVASLAQVSSHNSLDPIASHNSSLVAAEVEEEEDEDHPLVIDETIPINVNEEEIEKSSTTEEAPLNSSIVPLRLGVLNDENKIRQATNQIAERIQEIKTSNAEYTVKKQGLLHILDKLYELEKQEKYLKLTKNENPQDPAKQQPMENEVPLKPLNKNRTETNEESKCVSLPINAVTDEEKISALNSQDKNKDQSDQRDSTEQYVGDKLMLVLNPFAESDKEITQNKVLEKTMTKKEENAEITLVEKPSLALDSENVKTVDDKLEKTDSKDCVNKELTNKTLTATPESAKMTLRSQRKIITTKADTKIPYEQNGLQDYLPQPKVVISNIKPRRLKIAKRPLNTEPNNCKEVLDKTHLPNDSNAINIKASDSKPSSVTPEKIPLLSFFNTPNTPKSSTIQASLQNTSTPNSSMTNISLFNISTPNVNDTQYTDDWEDCIDETRIMNQLKASPVKSKVEIIDIKYLKSNDDLRYKIEEKKKLKENLALARLLSSPTKMATCEQETNILAVENVEVLKQNKTINDEKENLALASLLSSPTKMATCELETNILAVENVEVLEENKTINNVKENVALERLLSSPTQMETCELEMNILAVENVEVLEKIKTIDDEKISEEPKSTMETNSTEQCTNKNEDKVTENIVANITEHKEKIQTDDNIHIDDYEIVEKTIAIKCAQEQENNFEKILDQTSSVITKNIDEEKRYIEKSYDDQKSTVAIERKSPVMFNMQPKVNVDQFSDEENWDNPDSCDVKSNKNTYKMEHKSNNDKYSPEKLSHTSDYNDTFNNNSYGYKNDTKSGKNYKYNANQRGGKSFKYGEGQRNNVNNYNTGRQANNGDNYNTGRQANNGDNYNTGRQANNGDTYNTGRQANNADNYNTGRQANNADNYNTGRQANNPKKYTVEQRCSESRGPYQVKYDSDEDWDKDESNDTPTENSNAKNNNNNNTSSYSNNSYNSKNSYNSNNSTNNTFKSRSNSSNSSCDNQPSVIESPKKENANTEKSQSKNSQQHSSNSNSQMGKLEVNSDGWDIVSPTALSPRCPEIASPTYPSVSNLSDYTPAVEIDAHITFPPMPYCLREIILPNIEVNKPESLDKLLRSNTVDPRLLKYKDKGNMDISGAPPMLSYFSSQQISQYDPRRRTSVMHTATAQSFQMDCYSPMQTQNVNVLLYRYLQSSAWYQGLMSTMKMQINHSIAELVRALNNFQKERLIDPSAVFDVFKIDCAGELLEIMRNIGIFIDANGFISEDKGLGQCGQQHAALSRPTPINATYSFMPQLLSTPVKQGLLGYSSGVSHHSPCPVVLPPQMQAASFVSCYVDAPTLTPMIPRRSCGYNLQNMDSNSLPPSSIGDMHEEHASSSDVGYYSYNNKRNLDLGDERRNDRPPMRGGGGGGGGFNGNRRRGGSASNYRQQY